MIAKKRKFCAEWIQNSATSLPSFLNYLIHISYALLFIMRLINVRYSNLDIRVLLRGFTEVDIDVKERKEEK